MQDSLHQLIDILKENLSQVRNCNHEIAYKILLNRILSLETKYPNFDKLQIVQLLRKKIEDEFSAELLSLKENDLETWVSDMVNSKRWDDFVSKIVKTIEEAGDSSKLNTLSDDSSSEGEIASLSLDTPHSNPRKLNQITSPDQLIAALPSITPNDILLHEESSNLLNFLTILLSVPAPLHRQKGLAFFVKTMGEARQIAPSRVCEIFLLFSRHLVTYNEANLTVHYKLFVAFAEDLHHCWHNSSQLSDIIDTVAQLMQLSIGLSELSQYSSNWILQWTLNAHVRKQLFEKINLSALLSSQSRIAAVLIGRFYIFQDTRNDDMFNWLINGLTTNKNIPEICESLIRSDCIPHFEWVDDAVTLFEQTKIPEVARLLALAPYSTRIMDVARVLIHDDLNMAEVCVPLLSAPKEEVCLELASIYEKASAKIEDLGQLQCLLDSVVKCMSNTVRTIPGVRALVASDAALQLIFHLGAHLTEQYSEKSVYILQQVCLLGTGCQAILRCNLVKTYAHLLSESMTLEKRSHFPAILKRLFMSSTLVGLMAQTDNIGLLKLTGTYEQERVSEKLKFIISRNIKSYQHLMNTDLDIIPAEWFVAPLPFETTSKMSMEIFESIELMMDQIAVNSFILHGLSPYNVLLNLHDNCYLNLFPLEEVQSLVQIFEENPEHRIRFDYNILVKLSEVIRNMGKNPLLIELRFSIHNFLEL